MGPVAEVTANAYTTWDFVNPPYRGMMYCTRYTVIHSWMPVTTKYSADCGGYASMRSPYFFQITL